jgi:glycosyltransferase involved in cell wall biosynthesis
MGKTVLMVAFHYPPYRGGSGVHRALKFSKYLPENHWVPLVVSAHPRAYPQVGEEQLREIPSEVQVFRTFALSTEKHLALWGGYPRILALPDQWASWVLGAVPRCLMLIRKYRPRVLWTTYPIATAHLIGLLVSRISGIPWVADFRDSMTEPGYPNTPVLRKSYLWIERKTMVQASKIVFTTNLTRQMYIQRYPQWPMNDKSVTIENGYDEEDFKEIQSMAVPNTVYPKQKIRILHSGLIYPEERNPLYFFRALSRLKERKIIASGMIQIELRGSGTEATYQSLIEKYGISDIVLLHGTLPFHASLREAMSVDALLLMQGSCCNHQIPAKVYEYLRLNKPILALTDAKGETAALLKRCGGVKVVDLENEEQLVEELPGFFEHVRQGRYPKPDPEISGQFSRKNQSKRLTEIFESLL